MGCESPKHDADYGELDEGDGGCGESFVVAGEAATARDPCEGALDDPAPRQDAEALGSVLAFDDLDGEVGGAGPGAWLRDVKGGSVYLRLSTRPLDQKERPMEGGLRDAIIAGGYWLKPPAPGAALAIAYAGAVAPEAVAAHAAVLEDIPEAGLLAVTSADRLNAGWHAAERARQKGQRDAGSPVEALLAPLARDAALVTVLDGHPTTLSWLGAVYGHCVQALGVEHFGQSGDLPDLYRHYRIDTDAILDACAAACLAGKG